MSRVRNSRNKKRPFLKTQHQRITGGATPKKEKAPIKSSFLPNRFLSAIGFIALIFSLLFVRAVYVQVFNSEMLNKEADKRSLREQTLLSDRGSILDRHGKLLAVSVPMYAVILDPKVILEKNEFESKKIHWQALAKSLDYNLSDIEKSVKRNPQSRFMYLSRQVSKTMADYVKNLHLNGVVLQRTSRRFYPNGEETAHVLGYTNIDGEGIDGVEKSFDAFLQGKAGKRTYRKDIYGKVIEDVEDVQKHKASDLRLSIDEKIQDMMFSTIQQAVKLNQAKSGSAVLVNIQTGEILGMVNAPSYNPNDRSNLVPEYLRNRVITDTFEPGSTVKPFVVITALAKGYVKRNEIIDTGPLILDGFSIKDVAPRNRQSLDDILRNSSNRGVSRLALRMPENTLRETYQAIGFGEPTKLSLVGETSGKLLLHPADGRPHWSKIEQANIAYGYGFSVTPLQLARAYLTLGSFGIYRPLSITKVDPPIIGKRVLPEKITREVVNMLEEVAIKNQRAMVEGYRVGVKTGTAKKTIHGKKGYVDKYLAYTAGIAPLSQPRFALVVMIDEPSAGTYYGGAVAAPIFSRIMNYVLRAENIPPDGRNANKMARRTVYLTPQNKSDTQILTN